MLQGHAVTDEERWEKPLRKLEDRAALLWDRRRFSETERAMIWDVWLETVMSYIPLRYPSTVLKRLLTAQVKWYGGGWYSSRWGRAGAALFGAPRSMPDPDWRNLVRGCRLALGQIPNVGQLRQQLVDAAAQAVVAERYAAADADSLCARAIVVHLSRAVDQFQEITGIAANWILYNLRLREDWLGRDQDAGDHFLEDSAGECDLTFFFDGSQEHNQLTWGRTDGGWAVIVVYQGTVVGRVYGRTLGLGEPGGQALLASNGTAEVYAVFVTLALLALSEHEFGAPVPAWLASLLGPLHMVKTQDALPHWSKWGGREALLRYDSTLGVAVGSGRSLPGKDVMLSLAVRRIWYWLEHRGWVLRMRHVRSHTGHALNDLADRWAKRGKHLQFFRAVWNAETPVPPVQWAVGVPVFRPIPDYPVRGLETALLRVLLAAAVWKGQVTQWAFAKVARWRCDWTPGTMRLALGRVADLTARVRMALFTLWNNAWTTGWRLRFFRHSGEEVALGCRFCGNGVDRVEHYFGVREDPCPAVRDAAAAQLRATAPTTAEWYGLPATATPGEDPNLRRREVARIRYCLRRALAHTEPARPVGTAWLTRWLRSSRPLALGTEDSPRRDSRPAQPKQAPPNLNQPPGAPPPPPPFTNNAGRPPPATPAAPPPQPPPTLPPPTPEPAKALPAVLRAVKMGHGDLDLLLDHPRREQQPGEGSSTMGKTSAGGIPPTGSRKGSVVTKSSSFCLGSGSGPGPSRPPSKAQTRLRAAFAAGVPGDNPCWATRTNVANGEDEETHRVTPAQLAAAKQRAAQGVRFHAPR